jgi:hypothetical protein
LCGPGKGSAAPIDSRSEAGVAPVVVIFRSSRGITHRVHAAVDPPADLRVHAREYARGSRSERPTAVVTSAASPASTAVVTTVEPRAKQRNKQRNLSFLGW